jgi:hypothetical protein
MTPLASMGALLLTVSNRPNSRVEFAIDGRCGH